MKVNNNDTGQVEKNTILRKMKEITCKNNNWMYNGSHYYTITLSYAPSVYPENTKVYRVDSNGSVLDDGYVYNKLEIYPSVYLNLMCN